MSWKRGQKCGVLPKPCLRCGTRENPTKHHVWPRRFYGPDGPTVPLCRECHDKIEDLIPRQPKLHDDFYLEIIDYFVGVSEWKLEQDLKRVKQSA